MTRRHQIAQENVAFDLLKQCIRSGTPLNDLVRDDTGHIIIEQVGPLCVLLDKKWANFDREMKYYLTEQGKGAYHDYTQAARIRLPETN